MKRLLFALAMICALVGSAYAVRPDEVLDDPVLEQRARAISGELRCLVCQNQSIDDSEAELARDLRLLVRERLVEGDTDQEVFDYIVARYGEFVLLRPVFEAHTLVLWIAAPAVLLVGAGALIVGMRRRRADEAEGEGLTAEERAALEQLSKD